MKVLEYQAKELFRARGISTPAGTVVRDPEQARDAFTTLGVPRAAVKAQVLAGGRGKGGGIRLVDSAEAAAEAARDILAYPLVTHQTGPAGVPVRLLLVEAACDIAREMYLGIVLDRARGRPVIILSAQGGVEIETLARTAPESIAREYLHPLLRLQPYQARNLIKFLGLPKEEGAVFHKVLSALVELYADLDVSLAEINPLVLTRDRRILALDAKLSFDENALFRHPELSEMRSAEEETEPERMARMAGLSYVKLDGDIGCMVNGAGLAMATMDIIKLCGGEPANFLDVGGGATRDQVTKAFQILLSEKNIRAAFVNIFGGIMKCDTIADGIVRALREMSLSVPLIVRLDGTNVQMGRKILADSGLPIQSASDMQDGARKAVAATAGA